MRTVAVSRLAGVLTSVLAGLCLSGCSVKTPDFSGMTENIDKGLACALSFSGESLSFKREDAEFITGLILHAREKKITTEHALRGSIGLENYQRLSDLVKQHYDELNLGAQAAGQKTFQFSVNDFVHLAMRAIVFIASQEKPFDFNWSVSLGRLEKNNAREISVRKLTIHVLLLPEQKAKTKYQVFCDEL